MVDLPNGLLRLEAINWHKWAGSVVLQIDMRSIAFGIPETEAEAAKPAWFDSARHPQAQFRSSAVRALGEGEWADLSVVADEVQVRFKLQLAGLP